MRVQCASSSRAMAVSRNTFLTTTVSAALAVAALVSQPVHGASILNLVKDSAMYPIFASGYNGVIQPLEFVPPATLKKLEASKPNVAGDKPSWITYRTDGSGIAYVSSEDDPARVYTMSTGLRVASEGMPVPSRVSPQVKMEGDKSGYLDGGNGTVASCIVGDYLYLANYDSGSASVLKLDGVKQNFTVDSKEEPTTFQFHRKNGTTGPVKMRQGQSYAHDAVAGPSGRFVYVPDLGADQIHVIRTADKDNEKPKVISSIDVAAGSGPRHMAFYMTKDGRFAYLTSEMANTLTAFKQDEKTGHLTMIGKPELAVPHGTELGGNKTAGPARSVAEVAIAPNGKHVYVSDRGDKEEDHIAIFERDEHTGEVKFQDWVGTQGRNPRHMSLSHDGKFLAVANQDTGNVVIFACDASTGKLKPTGAKVDGLDQVAFAGFAPVD